MALSGALSGGIKFYENSDLLEVDIRPQSGNLRPRFEVINIEHPLALAQRNGVTMSQVHDFVTPFLR